MRSPDYLNKILMGFGANVVGQVGASSRFLCTMVAAEKDAFGLEREMTEAIRGKKGLDPYSFDAK